jgi:hypothetical protein
LLSLLLAAAVAIVDVDVDVEAVLPGLHMLVLYCIVLSIVTKLTEMQSYYRFCAVKAVTNYWFGCFLVCTVEMSLLVWLSHVCASLSNRETPTKAKLPFCCVVWERDDTGRIGDNICWNQSIESINRHD